jgi:polyisoprenoid-binding protein YceI
MFTTISGKFSKFDATIEAEDNVEKQNYWSNDSVTTGNADRDTFIEC